MQLQIHEHNHVQKNRIKTCGVCLKSLSYIIKNMKFNFWKYTICVISQHEYDILVITQGGGEAEAEC